MSQLTRKITISHTGTDQFYTGGACRLSLPAGDYRLRVYRGLEYRVATREFWVQSGQTQELVVPLQRWSNLPKQGWYSADSHLHIARPYRELNPHISKWMQAEDIHVANLLQWGNSKHFHNARQYAFGPDGLYHEGDYWLAAGQENPRTHLLGHTLILGGQKPISFPDNYMVYRNFWEEGRRQKAVNGWCHFALRRGGNDGIALDLIDGLIDCIEVLQNERGVYQTWYDALTLGFRVTPIAGTDHPCGLTGQVAPGRERFYTRVEGPLSYESWLEGIRRGRTFVTTGPLLEFSIAGKGLGEEIVLPEAGRVSVEACVRFDPERDEVEVLEIVENGEVIRRFPREGQSGEIRCRFQHQMAESAWLAVRASGKKRGEIPSPRLVDLSVAPSLAHSAAIYITLKNAPDLAEQRRAKLVAAAWLERLDELEKRLVDKRIRDLANTFASDGLDAETLRKGRAALLERVAAAKKYFRERSR